MRTFPSADDVAMSIIAAAKACGVSWQWIVNHDRVPPAYQVQTARARCYAAMALDRVFNTSSPAQKHGQYPVSRVAIARMVGAPAPSQDGFVNALESKLRKRKNMQWWSDHVFRGVVDAVRGSVGKADAEPEKPVHVPAPARRDVVMSVARERIPALPKRDTKPESSTPEPVKAQAAVNGPCRGAVKIEKDGISMDPVAWRIERDGRSVELRDQDAFLLTHHLVKVWPSVLPTELLAERCFGDLRDSEYRCKKTADRANAALAQVGLMIRYVNKFGFAVSGA